MHKKTFRVMWIGVLVGILIIPRLAFAQKEPIKIGFLAPITGPYAQIGKDMVDGANLYLEKTGNKLGGQKIELLVEDMEGQPATSLNKARKLVELNRIAILTGEAFANAGYALQPYVDSKKMPTLFPVVASDDLTQRKRGKWIVRTSWNASQSTHPFGEYAYKVLGYRKVAAFGFD